MTGGHTLNESTTVTRSAAQTSSLVAGEAVILHLESGKYFGLDQVGARIWELLETPRQVAEVRDTLVEEYEVDAARCLTDVLSLLGDLEERGLVEIRGEDEAAV